MKAAGRRNPGCPTFRIYGRVRNNGHLCAFTVKSYAKASARVNKFPSGAKQRDARKDGQPFFWSTVAVVEETRRKKEVKASGDRIHRGQRGARLRARLRVTLRCAAPRVTRVVSLPSTLRRPPSPLPPWSTDFSRLLRRYFTA